MGVIICKVLQFPKCNLRFNSYRHGDGDRHSGGHGGTLNDPRESQQLSLECHGRMAHLAFCWVSFVQLSCLFCCVCFGLQLRVRRYGLRSRFATLFVWFFSSRD